MQLISKIQLHSVGDNYKSTFRSVGQAISRDSSIGA